MNISQSKSILLTDILSRLGCEPERSNGRRKVYKSPFRNESVGSFMVNTASNTWYDFGLGAGGDNIDFVRYYTHINDTSAALAWLENFTRGLPTKPPGLDTPDEVDYVTPRYSVKPLCYAPLLQYLATRGIVSEIATRYCKEIWYTFMGRRYFGVAFPTRSEESYEVRNPYDKRCLGHKDISYIHVHDGRDTSECCVFEGFMDFLSYVTLLDRNHPLAQNYECDCIVLNSTACVRKALPELAGYSAIHCYLDNDDAGRAATEQLRAHYPAVVVDESQRYSGVNDVNAYLMKILGLQEIRPPARRKT